MFILGANTALAIGQKGPWGLPAEPCELGYARHTQVHAQIPSTVPVVVVMALYSYGIYSHGLYSYDLRVAYIVMAYILMAYTVMANIVIMAYYLA